MTHIGGHAHTGAHVCTGGYGGRIYGAYTQAHTRLAPTQHMTRTGTPPKRTSVDSHDTRRLCPGHEEDVKVLQPPHSPNPCLPRKVPGGRFIEKVGLACVEQKAHHLWGGLRQVVCAGPARDGAAVRQDPAGVPRVAAGGHPGGGPAPRRLPAALQPVPGAPDAAAGHRRRPAGGAGDAQGGAAPLPRPAVGSGNLGWNDTRM